MTQSLVGIDRPYQRDLHVDPDLFQVPEFDSDTTSAGSSIALSAHWGQTYTLASGLRSRFLVGRRHVEGCPKSRGSPRWSRSRLSDLPERLVKLGTFLGCGRPSNGSVPASVASLWRRAVRQRHAPHEPTKPCLPQVRAGACRSLHTRTSGTLKSLPLHQRRCSARQGERRRPTTPACAANFHSLDSSTKLE